jgi:DNA polymerase-3 subunit gamma/tau
VDLKERIVSVCAAEGWAISPDAVSALAVGANGGYRDALSLLEQVAAYTSGQAEMDLDAVHVVLGSVGDEQMLAAVEALADQDAAACFQVVAEALAAGVEVRQFLTGLRRRLRDLLMLAVGAAAEDAALPDALRDRLQALAKRIPTADLLWAMDQLNEAERDLRWSPQPRLLLESVLVKIAARQAPRATAEAPTVSPRPAPAPRAAAPKPTPVEAPLSIVEGGLREEPPPTESEDSKPAAVEPGMADFATAWNHMVRGLRGSTLETVKGMRPARVDRGILQIVGPREMFVEKATANRAKLEAVFEKALGRPMPLKFVYEADAGAAPSAAASPPAAPPPPKPLEDLAAEVFEADVVEHDG